MKRTHSSAFANVIPETEIAVDFPLKTARICQLFLTFRKLAIITLSSLALLTATGCAVTRGQETVGAYVDDTVITSTVKSRFIEDTQVSAAAISVETLNGTVMLSGFAKSNLERNAAETIARRVNGVKLVKNEIAVRP